MTFHVGFTGTQLGMSGVQKGALRQQLKDLVEVFEDVTFHHGDCIGADAEAHEIAIDCGVRTIIVHAPEDRSKQAFMALAPHRGVRVRVLPPMPYLERNQSIVDLCKMVIAAPKTNDEQQRSGTWATIRRARKAFDTDLVILRRKP